MFENPKSEKTDPDERPFGFRILLFGFMLFLELADSLRFNISYWKFFSSIGI